jgi:hypothetical protein
VASPAIEANWARIIPGTSKTKKMPLFWMNSPRGVLKKTRKEAPRAMGDMMIGISKKVSRIRFPGNSKRERA